MKIGPFTFTRDSAFWWLGALGSLLVMLATLQTGDPTNPLSLGYYGLPDAWAPYIRLGSMLSIWVSGKMASSPLPHSDDAHTIGGRS